MLQLHKTITVTIKRASLSFLNDALFTSLQAFLQRYLRTGGESEIRTLEVLRPTAFRVPHLRPLGQLSGYVNAMTFPWNRTCIMGVHPYYLVLLHAKSALNRQYLGRTRLLE